MADDRYPGEEGFDDLDRPPAFFPYADEGQREGEGYGELVHVMVDGVYAAESQGQISRFVLLSEYGGRYRKLPILIGPFEAQAIQLCVETTRPDRPLTHDLLKTIMDRLDATLDRVLIDDLWNSVYYAKLILITGDQEIEIDARPSDAIALAMRFEASIYVAEGLLEADLSV